MTQSLQQYDDFVAAVVQQIGTGLAAQVAPDEASQHPDDPSVRASKRLKSVNHTSTGARAVLLARFALATDDTLFLNNGVALLAAGHMNGNESPIDVSGLAGVDLFNYVRNTVFAEIQKRDKERYETRGLYLKNLRLLIAWLCDTPEVSDALRVAADADDELHGVRDALTKPGSYSHQLERLAREANDDSASETARNATTAEMQQRLDAMKTRRDGINTALGQLTEKDQCKVFRILLEMTDPTGRVGKFVLDIEEKASQVALGVLNSRTTLQQKMSKGDLFEPLFTGSTMPDLDLRAEKLFQEMQRNGQMDTGVVQPGRIHGAQDSGLLDALPEDPPDKFDVATTLYNERMNELRQAADNLMRHENRREPLSSNALAIYCEMRGLVGEAGPTEGRHENAYGQPLLVYSFPLVTPPRMGAPPSRTAGIPERDRSMVDQLIPKAGMDQLRHLVFGDETIDLVMIPKRVYGDSWLESTMPVRWRPHGELAEDQARVAILEHAVERLRYEFERTQSELTALPPVYEFGALRAGEKYAAALVRGACKLRQLEGLRKLATGLVLSESEADACTGWVAADDKMLYTRPSRTDATGDDERYLRLPYDAGIVYADKLPVTRPDQGTDIDSLSEEWISRFARGGDTTTWIRKFEDYVDSVMDFADPVLDNFKDDHVADAPHLTFTAPVDSHLSYTRFRLGPRTWVPQKHLRRRPNYDPSTATLAAYFREGIDLCTMMDDATHSTASGTVPMSASVHAPPVPPAQTVEGVRGTIWKDMLREIAISNDKLWVFVRTLGGAMGEDASTLLTQADDATQRAQRALEAERKSVAERVAAFHAKLVEIVVGGVMRTSKLEALPFRENGSSIGGEELFVMDSEFAKDIRALASGESGRPFFEANVAIQQVLENKNGEKTSLATLIGSFNPIVTEMHRSLNSELVATASATVGIDTLSLPRNSYSVNLRPDVVAAIRISLDRLHHELHQRKPTLWELVEGGSSSLSLRFAEFCAQVLVSTRASSGTSSLYVSSAQVATNALQTRAALGRLVGEARGYLHAFPSPDFLDPEGRDVYFKSVAGKQIPMHTSSIATLKVGMTPLPRLVTSSDRSMWVGRYG